MRVIYLPKKRQNTLNTVKKKERKTLNRAAQSDIVTSKKIFYFLFLHVVVNTDVISCFHKNIK